MYSLRLMFNDASAGFRDGAFARRRDYCLTRFRPEVDERGWSELVEVFRSAIAGIGAVGKRASERLAESGEDPLPVSASLMLFDLEAPARPLPAELPPPDEPLQ